jgi:methionyl-tRNA formyltransferase
VPETVLAAAAKAAINFHPASPDYPGIGCNNFALYENAAEYGVTCHHMATKVDVGKIIRVLRFPVFAADDVASLIARTYDYQLVLFYEIAALMIQDKGLPTSEERWTRKPFTRKEFDALGKLSADMSAEEIARRVRAIRFGSWRPTIELQGFVFQLRDDTRQQ